jgi:hypothetical protein
MGNSCLHTPPVEKQVLLDSKLVDEFYANLFAKYRVDGSLLLENGQVFSRITLDPEETQVMRGFLLQKNLSSRCFPLDTSKQDPLPRILFTESCEQQLELSMDTFLDHIEEEKCALLDLSDRHFRDRDPFRFLFQFQVDKPARRYVMRYNIFDPVAQIQYVVTQPETARKLWQQLRTVREVLRTSEPREDQTHVS